MLLIRILAKKKETAAATAVPPKVTDVTEQPNFQRKLSQVSYVLKQVPSYRKTYESSKVCSEKILKEQTVCGGEVLLKNAPLRRSFM